MHCTYLFVQLDEVFQDLALDGPVGDLFNVLEVVQQRLQIGDVVWKKKIYMFEQNIDIQVLHDPVNLFILQMTLASRRLRQKAENTTRRNFNKPKISQAENPKGGK